MVEQQQDEPKLTREQEANLQRHLKHQKRQRVREVDAESLYASLSRLIVGLGLTVWAFMIMGEGANDPSGGIVVIFGLVLLLLGVVLTIRGIRAVIKARG